MTDSLGTPIDDCPAGLFDKRVRTSEFLCKRKAPFFFFQNSDNSLGKLNFHEKSRGAFAKLHIFFPEGSPCGPRLVPVPSLFGPRAVLVYCLR